MDIIEFLTARIAEDEEVAKAATPGPWEWVGDSAEDEAFLCTENGDAVISAYGLHTEGYIECSDADRAHITRNNPARVLAECAAKRAMLANVPTSGSTFDPLGGTSAYVLRCLAAVYRDHPDYQQEWAIGG